MKLNNDCTHECIVCGARSCGMGDTGDNFARASKDTLMQRYHAGSYTEEEKQKVKVWLKVQFDYEI